MFSPCNVIQYFMSFYFCNHLDGKLKRADYFTLIVFLMSCDLKDLSLFLTVPWVGLQYVIVVFPDNTHLRFCKNKS